MKIMKKIVGILMLVLMIGSVSVFAQEIYVRGQLFDSITNEPISGAKLQSAYDFSPNEVITDIEGRYEFKVFDSFTIQSDLNKTQTNSASFTFWSEKYGYSENLVLKHEDNNINNENLVYQKEDFDDSKNEKDEYGNYLTKPLYSSNVIHLEAYPHLDIQITSDIDTAFHIKYSLKNSIGTNGPGQGSFTKEHYLSTAVPIDYDFYIEFQKPNGEIIKSSSYRISKDTSLDSIVSLNFFNGQSKWEIISKSEPVIEENTIYELKFNKGWNLVGRPIDPIQNKISYVYYLHPTKKEYFGGDYNSLININDELKAKFTEVYTIYGTPDNDDRFEFSNSAFMYITEDVSLSLSKEEVLTEKKRWEKSSGVPYLLFSGWNLIQVTPNMLFDDINKINGDCKIQKLYAYNSKLQEWEKFSIDTKISPEYMYKGLAVKVENNCKFDFK